MLASIILLISIFLITVIIIATGKLNRAIISLVAGIASYLILIYLEKLPYGIILELLFGTQNDNYGNFRSLILILSMMFIVEFCVKTGLFQFIAFNLIKLTRGNSIKLLITFCLLSVLIGMLLGNLLAVIILIPLTITVSRIIQIRPQPYILCEAVLVNLGGTIFSFSSIPNILIVNNTGILFQEFFTGVGIYTIFTLIATLPLFYLIYRDKLENAQSGIDMLLEFNAWNFVPDRKSMEKTALIVTLMLILFITVPSDIIPIEFFALTAALILFIILPLEPSKIIEKTDIELLLYLLGIFLLVGALDTIQVIGWLGERVGDLINIIAGTVPDSENFKLYVTYLIILWASAYIGANIDNIPITQALLPIIPIITEGMPEDQVKAIYYSLAIGVNWGDNLTPLGDNVLVMKIAEQHERPISSKDFFKLGFFTTNYQLFFVTMIISFNFFPIVGLSLLLFFISGWVYFLIRKFKSNKSR